MNKSIYNGDDIDLNRLIETRMLVSANSGGGKSFAIRNILENTHGKVQHIVLDMEGEFATLREKYDYVLIGKGGDLPADVRSAPMLAKKLLELEASAIIDLYELHQHERIRYVKLFLEAMVNAPKELWHPVLVVLDEAHIFCPEQRESEATSAVADIATRGRKRGFCLLAATQRLAKMNKDVAAELNNVLIGRTGLDIDVKRASESLGFTSKENQRELRNLDPGVFFAYGPAISQEVMRVKIGPVQTTHPKVGQRGVSVSPAPRKKVMEMLDKLKDLPQKAEEELREIEDYKSKIRSLNAQLTARPKVVSDAELKEASERSYANGYSKGLAVLQETMKIVVTANEKLRSGLRMASEAGLAIDKEVEEYLGKKTTFSGMMYQKKDTLRPVVTESKIFNPKPYVRREYTKAEVEIDEKGLRAGARKMLSVLVKLQKPLSRKELAVLSIMAQSGTFNTYLSNLLSAGYIRQVDDMFEATEEGYHAEDLHVQINDLSWKTVVEQWGPKFRAGARRILEGISRDEYYQGLTKSEIANVAEMEISGTFNTYLSNLKSAGLIDINGNSIKISEAVFAGES